jgi:hypothetical protein
LATVVQNGAKIMSLAWAIGLIGLAIFVWWVTQTKKLNQDPIQQELAGLMLNALVEGHARQSLTSIPMVRGEDGSYQTPPGTPREFLWAWQEDVRPFVTTHFAVLSSGQRQTRVAHALSLLRTTTSEYDFELLRGLCKLL